MDRVAISREGAYLLLRLLEEISGIDRRAGCSDRYFRQHFLSVARAADASGTLEELREALGRAGEAAESNGA